VKINFETAITCRYAAREGVTDFVSPLHLSTTHRFISAEQACDISALKTSAHTYTRISNPTLSDLELKLALLDRGIGAITTASGHAALMTACHTLLEAGDEFIASPYLYGGSINLFEHTFKHFGWNVVWVDVNDAEKLAGAFTHRTKFVFAETIANPCNQVLDIENVARVAHAHGVPLMVDNTLATPYLVSPASFGADIILYSLTKYMCGHGNAVGGAIVDAGSFDWKQYPRFTKINAPHPEYGGAVFSELAKEAAFLATCRSLSLCDIGACLSPFNAFLIMAGLETLHLRMQRHCDNATMVARHLKAHPKVKEVHYVGLDHHPHHAHARRYFRNGAGGVLALRFEGGQESCFRFINALQIFNHAANLGETQSMVIHPATTVHSQVSAEHKQIIGVTDDLVRLSVGIEHYEDLITDLDQALEQA
jgi:O-acetylhomoserine (thiol)-lyase